MKFPARCPLAVLKEEEFKEKMENITQQLALYRQEGEFLGFDDRRLYYEYFQCQDSRGAVIVVHGLSEFTKKYYELAWYLLGQGYDVFLYDQRGHGQSCRLTPRRDLIHVDKFSDYQKDLHRFICDVVCKATDQPLYLFAHSMGGAVAAQYLAAQPDVFEKAVLSAPMIEPLTGDVPMSVARVGLWGYLLFHDGKKKFWNCNEFDPNYSFAQSQDRSFARFRWYLDLRTHNACYRTTPMSFRWTQQSIQIGPALLRRRFLKKIRTPILMLCAQEDAMVNAQAQESFAQRCPVCQRIVLPQTAHALLSGTEETITEYVQHILRHFS